MTKQGILLTNTGTPDAPTTSAVRRYLREFLSDKRIVKLPRPIWLPILYGLILTIRPSKSAKLYKNIWLPEGSPMKVYMDNMAAKLEQALPNTEVRVGMNYGNPSIKNALEKFHADGIDDIIVLPIYPQYSNTTAASTFDRVVKVVKKWPKLPHLRFIKDYSENDQYITAIANSIESFWQTNGRGQHLLLSYHGLPQRYVDAGDPYTHHCEQTTKLVAAKLGLKSEDYTLCYQSQFGYDKWLKPSTQTLIDELPTQGITNLDVVCPGFSVDCLETLEEIAITGQEAFIAAGGEALRYIPALNDSDEHIHVLRDIIK